MTGTTAPLRRLIKPAIALVGLALLQHVGGTVIGIRSAPGDAPADLREACGSDNPYFATACYVIPSLPEAAAERQAVVIAFNDSPGASRHHNIATFGDVGSVFGLAYSAGDNVVYAAAYHRRQQLFGPGGPGAIYRIGLDDGTAVQWASVPDSGDNHHDSRFGGRDKGAGKWAGKTSLGDIDVNAAGTELGVVNLFDRHVYRLEVPSGQVLGRFAHGASTEPWASDARPFGLKYHEGRVYHGVVRSAESSKERDDLQAYVYSSLPDGSDMREVSSFSLGYPRGRIYWLWPPERVRIPLQWQPWTDSPPAVARGSTYIRAHPMPMLTDIEFDAAGNLIIGMGDRMLDMAILEGYLDNDHPAVGAGDLLQGIRSGESWSVQPVPEHYHDRHRTTDEFTFGALAAIPWLDEIVTNGSPDDESYDPLRDNKSVYWFGASSGRARRSEEICSPTDRQPLFAVNLTSSVWAHNEGPPIGHTGDIELLCPGPQVPVPSTTPTEAPTETVTPISTTTPTYTAVPTPTEPEPTASAIPTATPIPVPLYLPVALREHCSPEYYRSDIALVIDTSSSMTGQKIEGARNAALSFVGMIDLAPGRSQVTVVRYDREAEVVRELTRARATLEAAIRSLRVRSGTHIEKGLRAALEELQSPRHVERNTQVLVLLTDGVQTGTPGEELRAAAELRQAGVRVYAIGLGMDVDDETMRTIAGADERYYFAPDSGDLARIYGEIAQDLVCPGSKLWGGR